MDSEFAFHPPLRVSLTGAAIDARVPPVHRALEADARHEAVHHHCLLEVLMSITSSGNPTVDPGATSFPFDPVARSILAQLPAGLVVSDGQYQEFKAPPQDPADWLAYLSSEPFRDAAQNDPNVSAAQSMQMLSLRDNVRTGLATWIASRDPQSAQQGHGQLRTAHAADARGRLGRVDGHPVDGCARHAVGRWCLGRDPRSPCRHDGRDVGVWAMHGS